MLQVILVVVIGGIAGTLGAARTGGLRAPALFASAMFLAESVFIALVPGLLGRVMGMLMLCSFGSFPLSVAVSGVLVRHLGPVPFFPVAGGLVAMAMLIGLTQREFRMFGAAEDNGATSVLQAAEGSRK